MDKSNVAFTGTVPEYYDKFFVPIIFEEYAQDLAERISVPEGGKVLEIASGTGVATKQVRDKLAQNIDMIATDLNQSMLDIAKAKFSDEDNIVFQTEDAGKLSFPDAVFDAIYSQFSIMFFPNKLSSLIEARRVLKPGGRYIFNIWDSFKHNHFADTVNETILRLTSEEPIKFFEIPYCYFQIDEIKRLLGEAGFGEIIISVLPKISTAKNAKNVAAGFIHGSPISFQIKDYAGLELVDAVDEVEMAITKKYGSGEIEAKMQAIVFEAKFPN